MSHNYPYRRSPDDFRPHQEFYNTPDQLYPKEHNVYRSRSTYQEPPHSTMHSFPSSSRATETHGSKRSSHALSILDSCGLEPTDLSLLAEMPEHLITVETLPNLLMQIKENKFPKAPSRGPLPAPPHVPADPPARAWESRSQPVEYPPSDRPQRPPQPLPRERVESWQDRWGNPRQKPPTTFTRPSAESSYVTEHGIRHRHGDSHYDSQAYASEPRQSRPPAATQSAADYRREPRRDAEPPPQRKMDLQPKLPTRKEASDFNGKIPPVFPYACIICDIVVLSERDWSLHVNGAQHADSQLSMLEKYPEWDCRIQSTRRNDHSDGQSFGERSARQECMGTSSPWIGPNMKKKTEKDKGCGKVVCVKFVANSIDEEYIKKLLGQFGNVVKVIMFPALAFVEMGSKAQAEDIVKYYTTNPLMVKGGIVQFSVSATFNFLQSARVVSFSPLPPGGGMNSELTAIAKRFGSVKNTLYLPTRGFVEMTNAKEAENLVEHHSANPLKLKGKLIQVAFSSEYDTLKSGSPTKTENRAQSSYSDKRPHSSSRDSPSPKRRMSPSPRKRPSSSSRDSSSPKRRRRRSPSPRKRPSSSSRDSPSPKRRSPSPRKRPSSSSRDSSSPKRRSRERRDSRGRMHTSDRHSSHSSMSSQSNEEGSDRGDSKEKEKVSSSSDSQTKDQTSRRKDDLEKKASTAKNDEPEEGKEDGASEVMDSDSDLEGVEVMIADDEEEQQQEDEPMETLPDPEEEPLEDQEQKTSGDTEEAEPTTAGDIEAAHSDGQEESAVDSEQATQMKEQEDEKTADLVQEVQEKTSEDPVDAGDSAASSAITVADQRDEKPTSQTMKAAAEEDISEPSADKSVQEEGVKSEDQGSQNQDFEEEDFDFPESLENCITLDELNEETASDDQDDETKPKTQTTCGKVVYIRNLPNGYYTDAEFVRIAKCYGKVARYFLVRGQNKGFIEMEHAADAKEAASSSGYRCIDFHGSILTMEVSRKYDRLTAGWSPECDSDSDGGQRRQRRSKKRRDEQVRSRSHSRSKSVQKERATKKTAEKERSPKKASRKKESVERESPERESSVRKSREEKSEDCGITKQDEASDKPKEDENKNSMSEESIGDAQPVSDDGEAKQVCTSEGKTGAEKKPAKTGLEPYKPNNPLGREFVRPVVGYLCNLCNVIYASEEEAKDEHCSSLSHYQKLKEHLEKKERFSLT